MDGGPCLPAFLKANGLTLAAVAVLVVLDEINIASHLIAPGDRIITEKAIMALLGATTVQVGAIAALIARRQVKPDGRADAFLAGDANMTPALFGKTIDH
jgi:hypothetical protein